MSKEDIDKAVREAQQFAEEDKKRKEELDIRNGADQLRYEAEKILTESGDKISDDDKASIRSKIDALQNALNGNDINTIKSAQEELQKVFYDVSAKLYQQNAPQGGAEGQPGAGFNPGDFGGAQNAGDGDFTDVD